MTNTAYRRMSGWFFFCFVLIQGSRDGEKALHHINKSAKSANREIFSFCLFFFFYEISVFAIHFFLCSLREKRERTIFSKQKEGVFFCFFVSFFFF